LAGKRRALLALPLLALAAASAGAPAARAQQADALNMRLLAHLDLPTLLGGPAGAAHDAPTLPAAGNAAGNWGYTSPDGRRFALTGTSNGLSIVEVTDPARPRNIGLVPGPSSLWREVRTYGTYAYVTTEVRHGLDVVDLSIPDRPALVATWNETFNTAHSLWIDEGRGLLFANGTRQDGLDTGVRILDLSRDPARPVEVGSFTSFYVHDSYSRGNVLYAAAIADGFLALIDVANPAAPREITRFFTGGRFTHNAWLSRDGRYVFTTDERPGQPVEGWDLIDPLSPRKVSQFIANPAAIAHNVLVDGDRLLVAHYTEGVYLLDVLDPERPSVLGDYDTFPGPSGGFAGVWGAYLFPGTNLVLASDMSGGLFVIEYTGR
jgi:choice-of-anchor B domain-containing protein